MIECHCVSVLLKGTVFKMGLFDFLKKPDIDRKQQLSNEDRVNKVALAEYLLSSLSMGATVPKQYEKIVEKECAACDVNHTGYPDRQTLLNRIIELAGTPESPRQRYILAKAYSWSHAEYRKQAIEYLNVYLNNELYENAYNKIDIPDDKENPRSWVSAKNHHLYDMYIALGDACLGEYLYEDALEAYTQANRYAPSYSSTWNKMAKAYVRMNDLPSALNVYEEAKKTEYYSKRSWHDKISGEDREIDFWKNIDQGIMDIQEKIAKRYKYKPKKK